MPGWLSQLSVRLQLRSWSHSPWVRALQPLCQHRADSLKPGGCFEFCVSLSLCPSPTHTLPLSRSQKLNKYLKKKKTSTGISKLWTVKQCPQNLTPSLCREGTKWPLLTRHKRYFQMGNEWLTEGLSCLTNFDDRSHIWLAWSSVHCQEQLKERENVLSCCQIVT